jgi:Zn-dependent protease with chaperone function
VWAEHGAAAAGSHPRDVVGRLGAALFAGAVAMLAAMPASAGQTTGPARTPVAAAPASAGSASYTLTPDRYARAVAYSRAWYRLHFLSLAWEILCLVVLVGLAVAPAFRRLAQRVSRKRSAQALVFFPLLLVVLGVLQLPMDVLGHRLSLSYEQSVQGWASWLGDWLKGNLVTLLLATPLLFLLYEIVRKSSRRWWLYFWLATLPVIVFVVFIAPVIIDPLFFRFEPLERKAPDLVSRIEKVTARGGLSIPRDRMYIMDASRKLNSLNAYVTGLGASKRVVVWDTTLERMTTPQTLSVFGHEMGHYVLAHVPKTIVFLSALLLVLLLLAHLLLRRILPAGEVRRQVHGLADWASLPVLLLVLTVGAELASPVINTYSRAQEHAADVYGLEVIHGIVPDAQRVAAESFQILGEINLADPKPPALVTFWLYSHPPLAERLEFAARYDPWKAGQTPRYIRNSGAP